MYEVMVAYWLQEQDGWLDVGTVFEDGDLEPDVIAQLLSVGVIVDLNAAEPEAEADEAPAKKRK